MNRAWAVAGIMLVLAGVCRAQLAEQYGKGFLPSGSYDYSQVGAVNLENGNLILNIPLLSYKQRGSLPDLTINLISNSWTWQTLATENADGTQSYQWEPLSPIQLEDFGPMAWSLTGMNYAVSGMYMDSDFITDPPPWDLDLGHNISYGMIYDRYGTPHMVGNSETIDGTGLKMAGDGSALDKQGVSYNLGYCTAYDANGYCMQETGVIEDPNGNQIQLQYSADTDEPTMIVDSVGRQIPFFQTGATTPGCQTLEFPGPQGGQLPMTVCHSLHTITTNFQAANPPALEYTGTRDLLDGVSLPDGRVWTFTYDQYGDISSILLPTGASISYQWQAVETYIDEYTFDEDRQVVSRKLYDGGSKYYTWNYKYFTPPK